MITKKIILLAVLYSLPVSADECNPEVSITESNVNLSKVLSGLSDNHAFKLTFPELLDEKVSIDESMRLDLLLEKLTKGMSTIVLKKYDESCGGQVVSELIFLQTGEKSKHLNTAKEDGNINALYINDMKKYVTEVLQGKRKAEKSLMTVEQKNEYGRIKRQLKKSFKKK